MPASTNPVIAALNTIGQSVWYDNLSRDVLRSGELARLIGLGVSGLTSNPTIFKQAIADTADYDDLLARPGMAGLSAEGVAEELMVGDVAAAADLLRPVHDATAGADGHASIEVSPSSAGWASPTPAPPTRRSSAASVPTASAPWPPRGRASSVPCGRAPARRTPPSRRWPTSRRWPARRR